MMVASEACIAYGYQLTEEDYDFLTQKYPDFYDTFEELNDGFPFHLIVCNSYNNDVRGNFMFGRYFAWSGCYFTPFFLEDILVNEETAKELKESIEKVVEHPVECNYQLYLRFW